MEKIEEAFNKLESIFSGEKKQILAIHLEPQQESALNELIKNTNVGVNYVSAKKAQQIVETNTYNFIVMNLTDNEPVSFSFLDKIKNTETLNTIPIIVYNSSRLSVADEIKLNMYAHRLVLKVVKSPERLLDEIVLFLHLEESQLSEEKEKYFLKYATKKAYLETETF